MKILTLGTSKLNKKGETNSLYRNWEESGLGVFPDHFRNFVDHNQSIKEKLDANENKPFYAIGHIRDDENSPIFLLEILDYEFNKGKFIFTYKFIKKIPELNTKGIKTKMLVDYIDLKDIEKYISNQLPKSKKKMFVIMPFDDKYIESAYNLAIKDPAMAQGIEVIRVDEIEDSGKISEQILEGIQQSDLIYADLTNERPNCYFELGYALALQKEIILTVKKGDRIHFDLSNFRFIEWETDYDLKTKFEKRLNSILKK